MLRIETYSHMMITDAKVIFTKCQWCSRVIFVESQALRVRAT